MCKKMSSEGEECCSSSSNDLLHLSDMTREEQMSTLQEKLKRTTKFLHEIQTLSPVCEEVHEDLKERQVFSRRILQVGAELQDARDVVHSLCRPPRLTQRQFDLVSAESAREDPANDPSVRFFGLDWQQLYAKCFALSLNVQIFRVQVLDDDLDVDLVLLSTILKGLASIEVDVTSHAEAVLNGRLSKSQQLLIQREQAKFSLLTSSTENGNNARVSKSRSFRDNGQQQKKQRQLNKYRKNKTTDLNQLSAAAVTPCEVVAEESSWQDAAAGGTKKPAASETTAPRRKTSFIQNVSSIFKNIR